MELKEQTPALRPAGRIEWLDTAKGYGILCVIFSHLCAGHTVSTWLFTFHLPLFFFLSGYVFHANEPFALFVKKKAKSILIPYAALAVPMVLFELLWNPPESGISLGAAASVLVSVVVQRRFWTLWFLACLFWLNLLFYGLVKKIRKTAWIAVIVLAAAIAGLVYYRLGGTALPWDVDVCLTAMPFFFVGYLCKKRDTKGNRLLSGKRSVPAFVLLGIVNVAAGFGSLALSGSGLDMFYNHYGCPPLTYLSAFAGLACVVIVSRWFSVKPIQYIGRNSMLYFAWHQTIFMPLAQKLVKAVGIPVADFPNSFAMLGERLLELALIVAALTVCNILISNSKLKFLLGR